MSKSRKKESDSARRERRRFSAEFKQEAVRLMYERRAAGVTVSQVARDLDVRPQLKRLVADHALTMMLDLSRTTERRQTARDETRRGGMKENLLRTDT